MKPKISEQQLTTAIVAALTAKRVWCWRVNSGMLPAEYRGKKSMIRLAPTGTPDILGVLPGGYLFGLEVKTAKGKQSPGQIAWQNKAEDHGVWHAVVRSISEAVNMIEHWKSEY